MLIGHKIQWEFLKRLAESNRVPQAMIFSGQNSLGKKKIALEFVKLLNCEYFFQLRDKSQANPCQECLPCKLIDSQRHPDFIFIEPIHISQIRDLQKSLNLKAQLSKFKSVIIENADNLNLQAQNCLLKTLEEPQGRTVLILIASKIEKLLITLRSRCQILKFYPLSYSEIPREYIGKISEVDMKKIFLLSQGRIGEMLNFLNNPQNFSLFLKNLQEIENFLNSDIFERFCFSEAFFKKEKKEQGFSNNLNSPSNGLWGLLEDFERYLKLVFLERIGVRNKIFPFLDLKLSPNYSMIKIKKAIELVQNLKGLISQTNNINPKLAFENLIINL